MLLKPGCKVVLKDLISKPELNNQLAIIEKRDDKKQRYQIKIEDTGAIIALKPQNLKQITDAFRRRGFGRAAVTVASRRCAGHFS